MAWGLFGGAARKVSDHSIAGKRLGEAAGLLLADVDRVVTAWVEDLRESGNGLLGSCGKPGLPRAFKGWIAHGIRPGSDAVIARCRLPDLQRAARALRKRALLTLSRDGRSGHAQRAVLAVARALEGLARTKAPTATSRRSTEAGKGRPEARRAPSLLRATALIQSARSPAAVVRAMLEAAIEVCGAASAVWWEQRSRNALVAKAARGVRLAGKRRSIPLPLSFWRGEDPRRAHVIELSLGQPEHIAFLENVGATHGLMVRSYAGRRCVGALSVHDGEFVPEQVDLLLALAHQGAAALRALALETDKRDTADKQRRCMSELGLALSSALSVDELQQLICASARGALQADACLIFTTETDQPVRFRARAASPRAASRLAVEEFAEIAEEVRRQPAQRPLWRTGSGLRGASAIAARQGFSSLLGLPLAVRGEALGSLLLLGERPQAFTAPQRRMMVSLAAQAAVTIENLQLIEDLQGRLLEMADLTWVSTRITSTLETEKIAATVVDAASKALEMPRVALFLTGPDGDFRALAAGQRGVPQKTQDTLPPDNHLGAESLATSTPRVVADAQQEGCADDPLVKWLGVRSLVCVPMATQQGLRGLFAVGAEQPRAFRAHTVALLSTYANQTALALQSALLHQDMARHLNQLTNLFAVSQALASSLELTETLERVLDAASELLDAPVCSLMLMDAETGELAIKAARGLREDHAFYHPLKAGEGLAGRAAQSRETLMSADVTRDGRFKYRGPAREEGLRAAIAAPLVARGRTVGVLNLYRKTPREFTEEEKLLVTSLANTAAVAIENARLYEEAQERAQFLSAMMGEISHRMRNTLQAVAGLLRMELERPDPRSTEEAIRRGIARLQSVAAVHDLMTGRELQFVDIKQVARRILQLTCQSTAPDHKIEARVSGARVMLPSQQAISVAMILSELADNAVRHGFAQTREGRISVSLAEAGGNVVIEVQDNGVGVGEDFDLETRSSLGLRVVRGLVEKDFGGTLELETKGGFTVRARLPKRPAPRTRR